ncbi:MAG: DUF5034 domain-containing protein [Prevotellaceae bacterium]|jgi:hypothetical protein|nr:DUF5034 domain-containing protein [Prevotellaceae bacterium]
MKHLTLKSAAVCCLLYLMTTATSCPYQEPEPQSMETVLTGLQLTSYNREREGLIPVTDGRCPKEFYTLGITPLVLTDNHRYDFYTLLHPITAVRIVAASDFDADHPAGSNITRFFYTEGSSRNGLATPIDTINGTRYLLQLTKAPAAGNYRFRVEFETDNNEVVTADTEEITLY